MLNSAGKGNDLPGFFKSSVTRRSEGSDQHLWSGHKEVLAVLAVVVVVVAVAVEALVQCFLGSLFNKLWEAFQQDLKSLFEECFAVEEVQSTV